MSDWKILVSDGLSAGGLAILKAAATVDDKPGINAEELLATAAEYDAFVVRGRTKVTAAVIEAATKLKAVGRAGVDKRIDVLATAIRGSMTVYDLEELELAYAPPYSSAKDPVNIAGFVAANALKGDLDNILWNELGDIDPERDVFIDLRNKDELEKAGSIRGALHIPLSELRERLPDLDRGKRYIPYCAIGLRAYVGHRILSQNGFESRSLSGGYRTYLGAKEKLMEEFEYSANRYARENRIPFFGICLGMQCAVIEFARNVLQLEGAHSTEINRKTRYPVIDLMEEQKSIIDKGGTMRLGGYKCILSKESRVYEAYGKNEIVERHRHRYEFNNIFQDDFIKNGMVPVGINPDSNLVEIVEIPSHKWFVGVQFHPEYSSTVINPHPLFVNFIKACID